jgi:MFS family permease
MDAKAASSKLVLYVVSLNHFTNDASAALVPTLFPVAISVLGFTNLQVGVIAAVGYVVNMVFQPITGHYSERFKAGRMLASGLAMMAIAMILFVFSYTFPLMLFSMILLRSGSSFFHPVGVSTISRTYSRSQLDKSMGFQSAFGNLGNFSVFLVSAPIYLLLGWRGPFVVYCLLDLATVITTLSLLKTPKMKIGSQQELNVGQNRSKLGLPLFFLGSMFISGGSYAVFLNFANVLLTNNHVGFTLANTLVAGWVASASLGAFLAGYLVKSIGRMKVMQLSFLLSALSALGFALFARSVTLAIISLLVNGFFISVTYPTAYSELTTFLGEKSTRKGSAFGILFSAQIIGSAAIALMSGLIASSLGLSLAFEIVTAMLIAGFLLAIIWDRQHSQKVGLEKERIL